MPRSLRFCRVTITDNRENLIKSTVNLFPVLFSPPAHFISPIWPIFLVCPLDDNCSSWRRHFAQGARHLCSVTEHCLRELNFSIDNFRWIYNSRRVYSSLKLQLLGEIVIETIIQSNKTLHQAIVFWFLFAGRAHRATPRLLLICIYKVYIIKYVTTATRVWQINNYYISFYYCI